MHERGGIDDDHDRLRQQPGTVLAVRLECPPVREVTRGEPFVEFVSELGAEVTHRAFLLRELGQPARALFFGFFVGKGRKLLPGDVTQIADEVHRLVIPDQHVHHAAGRLRFRFEPNEQIHGVARVGTPVEDVSDDHEVRGTSCPAEIGVNHPCIAQRCDQGLVSAVNVGNSDDALDAAVLPVARTYCEREKTRERQRQESGRVSDHFSKQVVPGTSVVTSGPCGNLPDPMPLAVCACMLDFCCIENNRTRMNPC